MFIMAITAFEKVRRRNYHVTKEKTIYGYDVFWYTHQLYLVALGVLLLHAPRFWMWLMFPALAFLLEKLIRNAHSKEPVNVVAVSEKGGDVIKLVLQKENFHYRAGQYIYLCVPEISKEYHPFTVTSAPEENLFHLHIRCRGDWTRKLRDMLNPNRKDKVEFWSLDSAPKAPKKLGPFGLLGTGLDESDSDGGDRAAPPATDATGSDLDQSAADDTDDGSVASEVADADATTRLSVDEDDSVLRPDTPADVLRRRRYVADSANSDSPRKRLVRAGSNGQILRRNNSAAGPEYMPELIVDGPYGTATEHVFRFDVVLLVGAGIGVTPFVSVMNSIRLQHQGFTRQASDDEDTVFPHHKLRPNHCFFYWVCRDQDEFAWFSPLLEKIEDDSEMRNMFELNTFVTGEVSLEDLPTHEPKKGANKHLKFAGRPNWHRIFKDVAIQFPTHDIGVFLCGPRAIGHELKKACRGHSTRENEGTQFHFFQETF
jgi:ferredoxin-NADP reductase